mmetsp:Transcript_1349/g.1934  ORF Transcript_1349/g.1934 Transcript_1349/m.1934 type:complete len:346 (+) Transcript_1349:83-1120(+)
MSETYLNLLLNAKNWKFAVNELKSNPKDACIWNETYASDGRTLTSRVLPIHTACALNAPVQIVRSLIVANRSGLKEPDNKGFLPIHYACCNSASKESINELIIEYPDSVDVKDHSGMLPLHHAAFWGPSSLDVIKVLLTMMNKKNISSKFRGDTALDLATRAKYELQESVVTLLKKSGYFSYQHPETPKTSLSSNAEGCDVSMLSVGSVRHIVTPTRLIKTRHFKEVSPLSSKIFQSEVTALKMEVENLTKLNHLQSVKLQDITKHIESMTISTNITKEKRNKDTHTHSSMSWIDIFILVKKKLFQGTDKNRSLKSTDLVLLLIHLSIFFLISKPTIMSRIFLSS